jgi:IS30 family transposase
MRAQSADLREPWQHSLNENTNCLFRQYISKGTDFLRNSPAHRSKVARQLKERPCKTLEFETWESGLSPVLHRPVETAPHKRTFS